MSSLVTTAKKKPVDKPHIRMPVRPSMGPSNLPAFGQNQVAVTQRRVSDPGKIKGGFHIGHAAFDAKE